MDDIGCFLIHPVTRRDVEALHAAVRAACVHVKLPLDRMRVAYSAHAHPTPTFGSPFLVVHLHAGTEDDVYDPYLFTIETGGSAEDCSLAAYVCAAFDLALTDLDEDDAPDSLFEVRGWTVAREARTSFHSVVWCGPNADEERHEDESAEPLAALACDLRLSTAALVALLQTPATRWTALRDDLDESTLTTLRPLLPPS